ncbi:asparagine synthetase B family protein [Lysinibacillus pakistanensis]|uniref:asparagine synthase (glutamine-hydrolyzing) n=1 Tax=Lysinibacillus pakistanensis TaxID=759811 RepID=A0AAX3WVQ5_9BACI|nr:asparagine synthase-related protein [Lysinibacillus pakistanensis]MDM5230075.1 asparagine synthase-related protein [Lysinibacillus pakistanensis]WHY45673.1 asparagine synthase-related protein [Lysinibacillus pakistanensis]WHY50681.1 asparagine synthase-related protein [Lysinibacillus pakistanensis]
MGKFSGIINLNNESIPKDKILQIWSRELFNDTIEMDKSFLIGLNNHNDVVGNEESIYNDKDLLVIADLRIDNLDGLKENLKCIQSKSLEIILHSYKKWGIDFLKYINGEFAIFIFDKQRNLCFLARDSFGLKSLFYMKEGHNLFFSTELKFLEMLQETTSFNKEYFIDYIYNQATPPNIQTPFNNIFRVEKATYLEISKEKLIKNVYWELLYKPINYKRSSDYVEHFRDIFSKVILNQSNTYGKVSIMMSGGLDSTSIYGIAKQLRGEEVFPVSNVYDIYKEDDERPYIKLILDQYGEKNHKFIISDELWILKNYFQHKILDEPCINTLSYSLVHENLKAAKNGGATVVLSGYAGDQVFGYNPEYISNDLRNLNIIGFFNESKKLARFRNETLIYVIRNYGIKGLFNTDEKSPVLSEYANNFILSKKNKKIFKSKINNSFKYIQRSQGFTMTRSIAESLGMEVRFPFLDRELVEFLYNIPIHQKINNATTKVLLRNSMRGIVPDPILDQQGKSSDDLLLFQGFKIEWDTIAKAYRGSLLAELGIINLEDFKNQMLMYKHGVLSKGMDYFATLEAELWLKRKVGDVSCPSLQY